ncbi:MAG: hypothetical protein WA183_09070 [Chthoniobacterales bacterium]
MKTAFAKWQVEACCRWILYDCILPTRYDDVRVIEEQTREKPMRRIQSIRAMTGPLPEAVSREWVVVVQFKLFHYRMGALVDNGKREW